jgi:hypothetical protein
MLRFAAPTVTVLTLFSAAILPAHAADGNLFGHRFGSSAGGRTDHSGPPMGNRTVTGTARRSRKLLRRYRPLGPHSRTFQAERRLCPAEPCTCREGE